MAGWGLQGNYERATVLSRVMHCQITGCTRRATYDVSVTDRLGRSGDWVSMCTEHTRAMLKGQERTDD